MNRITRWTALALVAATAPLVGCNVSTEGENRLARFSYDDPTNFLGSSLDSPIAVGTRATLEVQSLDAVAGLRVRGAKIDPPEIASVEGGDVINTLVIDGLAPGEAELTIDTDRGPDLTTIRVAEAAEIGVVQLLDFEKVLIGGTETLVIERRDAAGQRLVGVAPAELDIVPANAAERVAGADHEFRLRYLEAGAHSLAVGDSTLAREVVSVEQVATFDFAPGLDGGNVAAGQSAMAVVEVKDGAGASIGAVEGVMTVESLTPDICAVRFERQLQYLAGIAVDGLSKGACTIRGQLGAHSSEVTLNVE